MNKYKIVYNIITFDVLEVEAETQEEAEIKADEKIRREHSYADVFEIDDITEEKNNL